jgi:hypothetical protein
VIRFFGQYDCKFFLHSTPRQLEEMKRKWIREEYDRFVLLLQKYEFGEQQMLFY